MKKPTKARSVLTGTPAKSVAKAIAKKPKAIKKPAAKANGNKKASTKGARPTLEPAKRIKLVRDSFTMPREDFERIARLRIRAIDFKRPAKKSELLRAGLQALERLDDASLHAALNALQAIKTGRPKKRH